MDWTVQDLLDEFYGIDKNQATKKRESEARRMENKKLLTDVLIAYVGKVAKKEDATEGELSAMVSIANLLLDDRTLVS